MTGELTRAQYDHAVDRVMAGAPVADAIAEARASGHDHAPRPDARPDVLAQARAEGER